MKIFRFQDKTLSDLSTIEGLEDVEELDIRGTNVSDLSPLTASKNLQSLGIDNTMVTDLSPLSGLSKLVSLTFNNTMVTDLKPILRLDIEHIELRGTPLSYEWELPIYHHFNLVGEWKVSSFLEGHTVRHEMHGVARSIGEMSVLTGYGSLMKEEEALARNLIIKAHEEALKCAGYKVKTVKAFGEKYRVIFTRASIREVCVFGGECIHAADWMHTELGEELRRQLK
jgi:Leucine-rich repeat (LRR) protein